MVHRRFACVLFQCRERENSGISSRTPDLFELFYLSFFHFSTSSSSPVFLQLPLFSFLLHRLSLSFSLSFSLSRLHRSRYPHLPLSSTFSSSSSIQEGLHGTRNFSSPRHQHTQPPSKTMYTRATHEREIQLLSTIRGAPIDGWKSGDHRSNLGSNISFLPSRRSLRRIFSSTEDPRSRGATRACASPFLLLQRPSSRRGCLGGYYYLPLLVTPRVVTSGRPAIPVAR